MKWTLQILTGASATFLTLTMLAQQSQNRQPGEAEYSRQTITHGRADRLNSAMKASDVIGRDIQNYQHEKLGKVEDLAVDVESGRIVTVILSTGGLLGVGDTQTAITPGALHHDTTEKVFQLDSGKEKLKAAPKFQMAKWDDYTHSNRVSEVYSYYGETPYFNGGINNSVTRNSELPRNMDGTLNTDASRTVDKARNTDLASGANTSSTRNPDGTWTQRPTANSGRVNSSGSHLGYVQRASKLMGMTVKNLQDQKLGTVENLIVDLTAGRMVAIVISSGGFMGMGDELSAVPPAALRLNAEHDTLQLDATKETLASSPHFKSNEWPDLSQPGYVGEVYHAYKVEPYFATDADNTRLNVRDRDNRTLTPLDQGNSKADLNTTAQIRKEIIADKSLTVNARNVKIITKDGRVTLRGPVNSPEEKRRIAEIANRIARSENVNDQLEVGRGTTTTTDTGN